ncbi:hypothetical protein EXY72_30400 [Burkholderia pseudomallei]|nr:hypothetical protein EXY72_30400 [Burkholderia pseudomallei]
MLERELARETPAHADVAEVVDDRTEDVARDRACRLQGRRRVGGEAGRTTSSGLGEANEAPVGGRIGLKNRRAQPKHNRRAARRSLTRGGGRAAFARGECSTLAILNDLVRARRSRPH